MVPTAMLTAVAVGVLALAVPVVQFAVDLGFTLAGL